ncbi:MAG: histidine kinase [Chloroflexota bacterium]|nr:histidine kinase [Chloroflexota bacterium]
MSRSSATVVALGVIAFAAITTVVGALSGAPGEFLALDLATGLTFVGAGLTAAWVRPRSVIAPALLISGALWFVGSYAPSGQPVVTYLGFAFERYYDLVLAALLLILSSPAQRLERRSAVALLASAMAVRSLGRLFLQDPVRTYGCAECVPNPFAVWPERAAFETVEIASNVAVVGAIALITIVVIRRLVRAGPAVRRARWPMLIAGGLAMGAAAFDALEYAYSTWTSAPLVQLPDPWDAVFSWAQFAARTLVPLAFLVVTVRLRSAPGPLGALAARLDRSSGSGSIGDALRTALGDPSLVLLRPADGDRGEPSEVWITEVGTPAERPRASADRDVTFVGPPERLLAALLHDRALRDQPQLLEAVVRVLRLALENERLEASLREQLRAVTESRQRIVTATEEERRRLERDLHDGAQQRLVGVMLALRQAREAAAAGADPGALSEELDAAARQTSEAMRELRELARGIHPAILEDEGLAAAVRALSRRAGIPVAMRLAVNGRLPRVVESTAYFTIAEALTNAGRHARAAHAQVRIEQSDRTLEVEVTDDGDGGAQPERGSGLRGLADRVTAVGGSFEIASEPGRGTRIRATIPTP